MGVFESRFYSTWYFMAVSAFCVGERVSPPLPWAESKIFDRLLGEANTPPPAVAPALLSHDDIASFLPFLIIASSLHKG